MTACAAVLECSASRIKIRMKKTEHLNSIDSFLNGGMDKKELRKLISRLLHDETLIRNFRAHTSIRGILL